MLTITYTITQELQHILHEIDNQRTSLALQVVAPLQEQRLTFDTLLLTLEKLAELLGAPMNHHEIMILLGTSAKISSSQRQKVINIRRIVAVIDEEYPGRESVSFTDVEAMAHTLARGTGQPSAISDITPESLKQLVSYVHQSHDHPVILAALALSQWSLWEPYAPISLMGILHSYAILAQHGYHARGLLSVLFAYSPNYQDAILSISQTGHANAWLHYYVTQLHHIYSQIPVELKLPGLQKRSVLTVRQRAIIETLDHPDASITNNMVQKMFGISQITASRELSKLAGLGYLLPHGRSRNISYTRA